jgi:hypothetical protein
MEPISLVVLSAAKIGQLIHFIIGRILSWTGIAYLFKKSKKTGKKRYKWAAISLYVFSWLLVLVGYSALLVTLWRKFSSRL